MKINWNDLKIVMTVAKYGSLKKAAKELSSTESTVSRRISHLEGCLNIKLFERTPSGMVSTVSGEDLVMSLEKAEREFLYGINLAKEHHLAEKGLVQLTSVPILINHVIVPNVNAFLECFPDINLEVTSSSSELSIMQRETDMAIRFSRPSSDLGALTRHLATLKFGVFTHRTSIEKHIDFRDIPWISYEPKMSSLPQARWIEKYIQDSGEIKSQINVSDAESIIAVIASGHGKSLLPIAIAKNIVNLQELPYENLPSREAWLIFHPDLKMTKRVRLVIDWLVRTFRDL
jgi:DNA-binding transcriptional LysR family regulator